MPDFLEELAHNEDTEAFRQSLKNMNVKKCDVVRCGACRFYTPVGRRGGDCSQLGVSVQSAWKSCFLSESPFQKMASISGSDIKVALEPVSLEPLPMPIGRLPVSETQLVARLS